LNIIIKFFYIYKYYVIYLNGDIDYKRQNCHANLSFIFVEDVL